MKLVLSNRMNQVRMGVLFAVLGSSLAPLSHANPFDGVPTDVLAQLLGKLDTIEDLRAATNTSKSVHRAVNKLVGQTLTNCAAPTDCSAAFIKELKKQNSNLFHLRIYMHFGMRQSQVGDVFRRYAEEQSERLISLIEAMPPRFLEQINEISLNFALFLEGCNGPYNTRLIKNRRGIRESLVSRLPMTEHSNNSLLSTLQNVLEGEVVLPDTELLDGMIVLPNGRVVDIAIALKIVDRLPLDYLNLIDRFNQPSILARARSNGFPQIENAILAKGERARLHPPLAPQIEGLGPEPMDLTSDSEEDQPKSSYCPIM